MQAATFSVAGVARKNLCESKSARFLVQIPDFPRDCSKDSVRRSCFVRS
jgi:hypothetical protein